jgi:predicted PurR-regulated permease PerM
MNNSQLHYRAFLIVLILVSVGFMVVLAPFLGAVFWGVVLAILFAPIQQRLVASLGRENLAACITLLLILFIVILPLALVATSVTNQVSLVVERLQSGELDFNQYFKQVIDALPSWLSGMLERYGLADLPAVRDKLSDGSLQGGQMIAAKVFNFGQNTLNFFVSFGIMLYLLFFLLRDGERIAAKVEQALPLAIQTKRYLLAQLSTVIRATVKGNIVVAVVQGSLGGILFWFLGIQAALLWGVLMALLSLLPAVGAAMIWGPVALYFLATGDIVKGVITIAFGLLVIGLVDNVLRPILVGKDTRLPDYIVLVSTVGGLALFGLHGFVIGPVIAALFIAAWDIFSSSSEPSAPV